MVLEQGSQKGKEIPKNQTYYSHYSYVPNPLLKLSTVSNQLSCKQQQLKNTSCYLLIAIVDC